MQATGAAGSSDGAILDGVSSSIKATVFDLASSNPLTVAVTDATGAQITSFGGGTQFADGAARGTATRTISMVDDGTLIQSMKGDASGRPLVTIDTALPAGTALIGNVGIDQTNPGTTNAVSADTELPAAAALADTSANPTAPDVGAKNSVYNGATWDLQREVNATANTTGTGIPAVGLYAQFDDVAPTAITENRYGNVRMSTNRNLYNTIRDAAGNERGANVSAGNALLVDGSATTQPVSGTVAVTNAALGVVGGGVEATALRVTIASDSTGLLSIDDNGGSITVDGTITEANSAAIAASLSVLDDWDETDRAKVNLIVGQAGIAAGTGVDGVTVPRVTLATNVALPAGTNAIGKLAANSGVDIGDVDVASIATGTNAIGRVGHDITGIGHGVKTVTSAGTDEALAGSTACKRVVIQAQTDNTTGIAVGGSGVDATIATGTGVFLNPGDAFELEIDNLADVFIDALTNGEGARYTYFS